MTEYRIIVTQTNEWAGAYRSRREAARAAYDAIWDETTGDYDYCVSIVPVVGGNANEE